jgi:AbrB family looped-hinge helix DNA binding protein
MRVTMDRVGRIVVPKALRDRLGLDAEAEFDIVLEGATIRLDRVGVPERQVDDVDGWPVLRRPGDLLVTDDDVRALRDADQR